MDSVEHDVGAVSDFEPGRPHRLQVAERPIVLVRKEEDFYALRDICPHQGAPLSAGIVSGTPKPCLPGEEIVLDRVGEILICPWHGWEFDLRKGQAIANPGRGRVKTYPVRVEGDRVMVDVRGGNLAAESAEDAERDGKGMAG